MRRRRRSVPIRFGDDLHGGARLDRRSQSFELVRHSAKLEAPLAAALRASDSSTRLLQT